MNIFPFVLTKKKETNKMNNYAALTKCFYCGEDGQIILDKRLKDISGFNHKVVNMQPCSECSSHMEKGIILITIDNEKSDKDWNKVTDDNFMPNPYRTGGFAVITEEAAKKVLPEEMYNFAKEHRFMFIEDQASHDMGLFDHVTEGC